MMQYFATIHKYVHEEFMKLEGSWYNAAQFLNVNLHAVYLWGWDGVLLLAYVDIILGFYKVQSLNT